MRRSNSFIVLKKLSQSILDFSVLVCTAVPQLRYAFIEHERDPSTFLATNSHFRASNVPYSTERRTMTKYKAIQGANLLLSNFSFFESYFFALIDEIFDFHGGIDEYLKFINKKVGKNVNLSAQEEKDLSKLRQNHDSAKKDRYRKFTTLVESKGIVWPSEKLALYGAQQVVENRKRWKSVHIPSLIKTLLVYELKKNLESKFHNIRDDRNKIAHGKRLSYDLDKAVDANYFLYSLAQEIDEHVVRNFLVIEKYRS